MVYLDDLKNPSSMLTFLRTRLLRYESKCFNTAQMKILYEILEHAFNKGYISRAALSSSQFVNQQLPKILVVFRILENNGIDQICRVYCAKRCVYFGMSAPSLDALVEHD